MATRIEIEYLKENFDLKSLYEIGFFSKFMHPRDYDAQIKRICEWFGIVSIFQYETIDMKKEKYFIADFKTFSEN